MSVTPYFPFRRIVLTGQDVGEVGTWLEARPDERYRPMCSSCQEPLGRIHRWEERTIRDLNLAQHGVWIDCRYRQAHCGTCTRIRVEDLEFVAAYERVTRRLAAHLHGLCAAGLVRRDVGPPITTV